MENKSRVKNVIVFDLEQFQEDLVRELINNDISYVKIDNEFHFMDMIYRFYDLSIVEKLSMLNEFLVDPSSLVNPAEGNFLCSSYIDEGKQKVSYTKKMIRNDNRKFNSKINKGLNAKVNNFRR